MFSSALGERLLKFSQASNRIADGDVDPGRKTDTLDTEIAIGKTSDIGGKFVTWNFLYEVTCIGSDDPDPVNLCDSKCRPSIVISRFGVSDTS
jgi:hypothetical protein